MKNKNILYLTRTMGIGGTEKIIMQLCKAFKCEFENIVVCSNGGVHVEELEAMGIKHYFISDFEDKRIKNIIKTFNIIMKITRKHNIHIIHTHHRMAAFYVKLVKRFINIITIHTSHNTFKDKKKFTKYILSKNNIICVGQKVKENLVDYYGISKDIVHVIYNGVDQYSQNTKELDEFVKLKNDGYFLVTNIGRLSEQKGMEYFIKSANSVKESLDKVKFFIVGNGELESKLKKLTRELKLEEDMIFLGYRNDINNIIRNSDLIVLSSLWEGLPLTPIEAFMEKKTIVATNVDGTPEIVEDNVNGLLVEPKNDKAISDAILTLATNKALKSEMEKQAYKTYLNKFTTKNFIESHRRYYKNLIDVEKND